MSGDGEMGGGRVLIVLLGTRDSSSLCYHHVRMAWMSSRDGRRGREGGEDRGRDSVPLQTVSNVHIP